MLALVRDNTMPTTEAELPPPLVPREVSLRDVSDMPIDVRRLMTSQTWILGSSNEKLAALCLWMESWHQVPAGSLPNNEKMLAVLSQAGENWPSVREHALHGWMLCSDGLLYHPVVAEKAIEVWRCKSSSKIRTEKARLALQKRREAVKGLPMDEFPGMPAKPAEVKKMTAVNAIQLDESSAQWVGITDAHKAMWRKMAPGVDIDRHLVAAAAWIISNPKNRKKNYARYLTGWLSREQERLQIKGNPGLASEQMYEKASDSFRAFWSAYPRQSGLIEAISAWETLQVDKSEPKLRLIMDGLETWKASRDWNEDEGKFVPAPGKWLTQMRWLESPQPFKPSSVMTDRFGRTTYDRSDVTRDYGGHGAF